MEYVYRNIEINDNSSIIGDKDQVLQVILKRNDGFIFKKANLYYISSSRMEETLYHKKRTSHEEELKKIGKIVKDDNLIKLRNVENNFEYIGLYNGGKIMKVVPVLYNDLFIRYDCLLGFSIHLELLDVEEVRSKVEKFHRIDNILHRDYKFYLIHSEKIKEKNLDNFTLADYPAIKECAYLANENLLIEKRLGPNEELAIRTSSLVCFERTVNFHKMGVDQKNNFINKNDFLIVEGPGLVIFELNHQNTKKLEAMRNLKLLGIISLIFIMIGIAFFIDDYKYGNLE